MTVLDGAEALELGAQHWLSTCLTFHLKPRSATDFIVPELSLSLCLDSSSCVCHSSITVPFEKVCQGLNLVFIHLDDILVASRSRQ